MKIYKKTIKYDVFTDNPRTLEEKIEEQIKEAKKILNNKNTTKDEFKKTVERMTKIVTAKEFYNDKIKKLLKKGVKIPLVKTEKTEDFLKEFLKANKIDYTNLDNQELKNVFKDFFGIKKHEIKIEKAKNKYIIRGRPLKINKKFNVLGSEVKKTIKKASHKFTKKGEVSEKIFLNQLSTHFKGDKNINKILNFSNVSSIKKDYLDKLPDDLIKTYEGDYKRL